jgi:flagellin
MPLSINTNMASMTAQRSFMTSNQSLETAFERLSTGKRINSSVDDAAGLAIGTRMESQVRGLNQAIRNANDGISMVQIAEGALDEATVILQRMRDLAVQASNGSLGSNELTYLDDEQANLVTALNDVLGAAKFNGVALIDTDTNTTNDVTKIQIGANNGDTMDLTIDGITATNTLAVNASQIDLTASSTITAVKEQVFIGIDFPTTPDSTDVYTITINGTAYDAAAASISDLSSLASALDAATTGTTTVSQAGFTVTAVAGGIRVETDTAGAQTDSIISLAGAFNDGTGSSIGTAVTTQQGVDASTGAMAAIDTIDAALDELAADRAKLGASQSQLESVVRNLANVAENTSAAVGRIMDTDYAAETANLTKAQILQQAATSVLAQANAQPQAVLALLQ